MEQAMSKELIERLRNKKPLGVDQNIVLDCHAAADEIERLQSERDGLEGVNKILQIKHERLQARLEIDPRHNYDGIDSRDVTIRLQDELIDALEAESGRMQKICAAAYQMAGVVNAPVRFLDVLSRPYEATQEQIDALLPVREDEFEEISALRKDAERLVFTCKEFDGFLSDPMDKYDYAKQVAAERGHDEPTKEDEIDGIRRMIDFQANPTSSAPETSRPSS